MAVTNKEVIATKAWLSEFMLNRCYFGRSTGKPIYSYLAEYEEYKELTKVLDTSVRDVDHPIRRKYWAILYCLFVAERFRREYGQNSGEWSWDWAEESLNCNLSQQRRAEIIELGLDYWKRPIRKTEKGRNFLGSLFLEGGLPWPLIKSETHGFGRVIRKSLKGYHDNKARLGSTSDLIVLSENYLPCTFRNLDTRQLLAGVIEQLMFLAERYPSLKQEADPVRFLDHHQGEYWRQEFPLPLDEANAQSIINDWLRDASTRHAERKAVVACINCFDCEHYLLGNINENWQIETRLQLPRSHCFSIDQSKLTSTRVEVVFYEGKQLVARGGVLYGKLESEGFKVRFPKQNIELMRFCPDEPVSMVLLDNGQPVHQQLFANSALSLVDSPLVFEREGDEKHLLADASCHLEDAEVLLRLPENALCESAAELKFTETSGSQWFLVKENLQVLIKGDLFRVYLNSGLVEKPFDLNGQLLEADSIPNTVFIGWPDVVAFNNKRKDLEKNGLREFANGKLLQPADKYTKAGINSYSLKNQAGETLLKRRFGVLPVGFDFRLFTGDDHSEARIVIKGCDQADVQVYGAGVRVNKGNDIEGIAYSLRHEQDKLPSEFFLEVKDPSSLKAVKICLPFPYQGARLLNGDGNIVSTRNLVVDHLLGMRIALFATGDNQRFYLRLKLVGLSGIDIHRDYVFTKSDNKPLFINLFTYQNDVQQMLAAVDSQDAYIELLIKTPNSRLMTLNIKRYNGVIKPDRIDTFAVYDQSSECMAAGAKVAAMLLSDPRRVAIFLDEIETQGVGTGRFLVKFEMHKHSPWLLYPDAGSAIKFRPRLFIPAFASGVSETSKLPHSLHEAARLFHPESNPDVIDQQIAQMAKDLNHSGWQYLDDLRKNYSHLPLSTFESWLSLSKNPLTLAISILRLEMDEAFSDRMRDELAIIWESVSLSDWSQAYKAFSQWLVELGLPRHFLDSMLSIRQSVIQNIVSGFKEMEGYFETGDVSKLPSLPPDMILPGWADQLKESYGNTEWPKELTSELSLWVEQQELPDLVKALSTDRKCDAVIYLPIFMAYVTSGKIALQNISPQTPLPVLKFYIRKIADFNKNAWYKPTHALMTSYLLANNKD